VDKEQILRYKLDKLENQRDVYWKQRAKVNWLTKGDRNTSFFHSFASERKKHNRIKHLKLEDGSVVEGEAEMAAVVTNYFNELFTSSAGHRMNELLEHVVHRVTPEMNDMLLREFTREEVKDALNCIGDLKAPGPDGMPAIFYKWFWDIIGDRVTDEVLQVLCADDLPAEWNETNVALIPKVKKSGANERSATYKFMQCCIQACFKSPGK
jgi:hypothetical protein